MQDRYKKKEQLIRELAALRRQFADLESAEQQRKKLEAELQDSQDYLNKIINSMSDPIFVKDSKHRLVLVNDAECILAGRSREELIGKTDYDFFPKEQVDIFWQKDDEVLETGRENINEEEITDAHGNKRVIATKKTLYIDKSGNRFIVGIIRDITERKRSEGALQKAHNGLEIRIKERTAELEIMNEQLQLKMNECNRITDAFRATFEQAAVGVAHLQPDGRFLMVNQKICDVIGYTREELLGKTCHEITYPYDLTADLENVRKVLANENKTYSMEKRYICKDGSLKWVNVTVSLVRDIQGIPVYFISVVEDISEHKKLEEQLFQAQKMEAIGQLAGGIAHDFNNLLTAVIGYGNLLKAEVTQDEQASSYVNQILRASERAAALTNELLTFSRKQIISPRPVNLNNTIREVEKLLSRIIGEDIELTTVLSDKDLTIIADSTQIEQVLMNLATNARDAMPDGGSIIITTDRVELGMEFIKAYGYGKPGSYSLIAFEDTGTGMDERTRERIFEPFFTTKEVGKGTGLGLAMVYGIIKQHEGYINAYSEPGMGTTFKIFLPLIQTKADDKETAQVFPITTGNETILIGEDDIYVRKFIKEMLLKNGYVILEAVDGEDAVKVFNENQNEVDLVILDVLMPKKNGNEVYNEIKKINSRMKVIFTSGHSSDIIHKRGVLEENLDIISKPIMPEDLLTKVRRILDT